MHSTHRRRENEKKGGRGWTRATSPLLMTKRKTRVKCHTIIQQERRPAKDVRRPLPLSAEFVNTFEFYRFRFRFEAIDAVKFPARTSANTIRGALGTLLLETATP